MKRKKFNTKLKFSKETVVNLNNHDMSAVHGGLQKTIDLSRCATNCLCDTTICSDFVSCPPTLTCTRWDC